MYADDRLPRFPPGHSPVVRWQATLPLIAAEDGSPILLPFVRWAFSLNEGDLLAVSPGVEADDSWRFLSYGERAWGAADACNRPWPYIEELLRRPLAAVGANGVLRLPEEAEALRDGQIMLHAEVEAHTRAFTLQPMDDRTHDMDWLLEARYVLPILPGFQVMLPDDLLWILDLGKGDQLAYETQMIVAEYVPWELRKPPEGLSLIELGPGGLLALPDALRIPAALTSNAKVGLKVIFWEGVKLEIRPWVS
jgi:hypothetical protein